MPDASPELSVVCRKCGSEVSPYVTECPYCGTRLRRRAPKLERQGDELRARESLRARRRRKITEKRLGRQLDGPRRRTPRLSISARSPYVTTAAILGPALLIVIGDAAGLSPIDLGAIFRPAYTGAWRFAVAPFVYDNAGYLFATGLAFAFFVPTLERRLGLVATLVMLIACGALGMLATVGLDNAFGDGIVVAAGGNGVALGALGAWFALRQHDLGHDPTDQVDRLALGVAAAVLLLLPLADVYADPWAGLIGGLVGLSCGAAAARFAAPA